MNLHARCFNGIKDMSTNTVRVQPSVARRKMTGIYRFIRYKMLLKMSKIKLATKDLYSMYIISNKVFSKILKFKISYDDKVNTCYHSLYIFSSNF
jgi:hypothetical protein